MFTLDLLGKLFDALGQLSQLLVLGLSLLVERLFLCQVLQSESIVVLCLGLQLLELGLAGRGLLKLARCRILLFLSLDFQLSLLN